MINPACGAGVVVFIVSTIQKFEHQKWQEHKTRESAMVLSPKIHSCTTDNKLSVEHEITKTSSSLSSFTKVLRKQADLSWQVDQERSNALLLNPQLSPRLA